MLMDCPTSDKRSFKNLWLKMPETNASAQRVIPAHCEHWLDFCLVLECKAVTFKLFQFNNSQSANFPGRECCQQHWGHFNCPGSRYTDMNIQSVNWMHSVNCQSLYRKAFWINKWKYSSIPSKTHLRQEFSISRHTNVKAFRGLLFKHR